MNKFLKNLLLLSVTGISIGLFSPAYAVIPEKCQEVIDYSKSLSKEMSNADKIKTIQEKFKIDSEALPTACLISNFLTPELANAMFDNTISFDGYVYSDPILTSPYKTEYEKIHSLFMWVVRNIRPSSQDDNSVNIYSILNSNSFNEMKAMMVKNGD